MAAATFERYWMDPVTNQWNIDGSSWLSLDRIGKGNYESSEGCYMTRQANGEIWEFCRDVNLSLGGKAPFVISKYRALPVRA